MRKLRIGKGKPGISGNRGTIRELVSARFPVLVPTFISALFLATFLAGGAGCDRRDNDWSAFDPNAKLVIIQTDTLSIVESGQGDGFVVSLRMVPSDTVTLFLSADAGQVQIDPDTLVFPPVDDEWAAECEINVRAMDDNVQEGPHEDALTIVVTSNDKAYEGQGGVAIVPVLIGDNDCAGVTVSDTLLTLVESIAAAVTQSYNVVLQSQPTDTVMVAMTVVPPEPSLHVNPDTLRFGPGDWDVPQQVTLWIELDDLDFDNLGLVIEHAAASADSNYGHDLDIPSLSLTVFDGTATPMARVALADPGADTLQEWLPDQTVDLVVTIDRSSSEMVILHLATLDGTATGGADFIALDEDLVFAQGDNLSRTISVTGRDDTILELPEEFSLAITAVQNVVIGDADRLILKVQDDDTTELTLSVANVNEDSGAAEFIVSVPQVETVPLEFKFVTTDGTALAGDDYESVDEFFAIEPGQTQQVIPVVLLSDADDEPDEIFTAHLESLSGHATWSQAPVSCTILSDDPQAIVLEGGEFGEADGNAVFTIRLDAPYGVPVTLMLNTLPGDGLGDIGGQEDAVAATDFGGLTGVTRVIPAGATITEFSVAITNDNGAEALYEYFRLEIASADQAGFTGLIATSTIVDDDQPCLQSDDLIVDESVPIALFRVDLQTAAGSATTSTADVTFQVETMDQTASQGDDYTGLLQTVTIPAGQGGVDIPVTLSDDGHDDDNEMFVLVLTDPVNAAGTCRDDAPFCRIVDDEFPSINLFSVVADQYNEGSSYEFVVRLTTPRQDDTSFDLNLSPGTSNGQGVDYTFTENGTRTILAYQTEITFSVPFLDDQLAAESDEVLQISISNANVALGVTDLSATIIDAPELEITGAATSEGTPADFLVSLDETSTAIVQFMVQLASGTATAGADFPTGGTGPYSIAAGSLTTIVPVPATAGDGGDAAVEDFIVTLITSTNATMGPFNSAVGTILDMDPPELSWAGSASAVEGSDIQLMVSLSWSSEVDVQFELTFTDGTAARSGIDYDDSDTGPYTVPPGAVNYVIPVPTTADGAPELTAEDFTVTLHSPVDAVIGSPDTATGTVLDGDQPELTIPAGDTVIEGGDLFFTVHLSQQTIVPVFFNLEYDNGSTQGATDFDATNTGQFSMAAGTVDTTITVHTFGDVEHENQEAFIVRLATDPVNAVLGDPLEANGVIDDDDP
ncbi:MAG: hypothetical protein KOO60_01920 [Gemmatimonadales bacterium]|nr:hypothetical protein [Gemmatimonadales bacterium]